MLNEIRSLSLSIVNVSELFFHGRKIDFTHISVRRIIDNKVKDNLLYIIVIDQLDHCESLVLVRSYCFW